MSVKIRSLPIRLQTLELKEQEISDLIKFGRLISYINSFAKKRTAIRITHLSFRVV